MKKFLSIFLAFIAITLSVVVIKAAGPYTINNITISPDLDISFFDSYTFTGDITPEPPSATIDLLGVNGEGGNNWNYYVDGTTAEQNISFEMTLASGTTWEKTTVRPDHIYPTVLFAPTTTTWYYEPTNLSLWRNQYHLLYFNNPFAMVNGMNFWIEFNTTPRSTLNSSDLEVYLVKKDKDITFFQSDWRSSTDVERVVSVDRNQALDHTHTTYSSHHLVTLTANADGTIGTKNLDINDNFWIILYNKSPNINRSWNLRYHQDSICDHSGYWYLGSQSGWTTSAQAGCPDVHTHFVRRITYIDGVKATVSAGDDSAFDEFFFAALPNLAPNTTTFTNPLAGAHSGTVNVTWNAATDVNDDNITYNLYLLDSDETLLQTLVSDTALTSFSWDTTDGETNTDYILKGEACDDAATPLCTDFYSEVFSINNAETLVSLTSITIASSNSNPNTIEVGDTVTLSFTADDSLDTPTVSMYTGGYAVTNSVTIENTSGNNWTASYIAHREDTSGKTSFIISSANLDLEYTELTSGNDLTANIINTTPTASVPEGPKCQQTINHTPDLFQIDVGPTSATLHYTSVNQTVTDYFISYTQIKGQLQHGTFTSQNRSKGVLSYTINHLLPNTIYYFKVRGQNDCAAGEYSQEMSATTGRPGSSFYYYHPSSNPLSPYLINKKPTQNSLEIIKELAEDPPPTPTQESANRQQDLSFWQKIYQKIIYKIQSIF